MSKSKLTRYRTTNWCSYNASLKKRGSLTVWFDPVMVWEGLPTGRRGRRQSYSAAAIQTCLTLKVLFGFALRQTTGFVESLLRLAGLAWSVPDFSTLSRRQKSLTVDIAYRGSDGPLYLLIDSTGIKVEGEGEWHARNHGASKHRIWRKLHIAVDEGSLEIRAVEITGNDVGDAPVLPGVTARSVRNCTLSLISEVSCDDTRDGWLADTIKSGHVGSRFAAGDDALGDFSALDGVELFAPATDPALSPGSGKACRGAFADHRPLEFSESPNHLHHHPTGRSSRIDVLRDGSEACAGVADPLHDVQHVFQGSGETIELPDDKGIALA